MYSIPRHYFIQWQFNFWPVAAGYSTGRSNHCQKLICCISASGFLYKTQSIGKQNHCKNNDDCERIKIFRCISKHAEGRKNHVGCSRNKSKGYQYSRKRISGTVEVAASVSRLFIVSVKTAFCVRRSFVERFFFIFLCFLSTKLTIFMDPPVL